MSDQRVITIYSTKGGMKEITTTATTWGELKPQVEKAGYDLRNLAATCGNTRNSLDRDDAILQTGDYTIFLRPVKTKSGATLKADAKRSDVNAVVKEMTEKHGEDFRTHINSKGNWTRVTTPEIVELVNSYKPSGKKTDNGVGKVVKTVAESKKPAKKTSTTEKAKATEVSDDAFADARQVLEDAGVSSEVLAGYDKFAAEFSPEALEAKSSEDAEAQRLREKEEKLAREFNDL
jgi:hypothetical protein